MFRLKQEVKKWGASFSALADFYFFYYYFFFFKKGISLTFLHTGGTSHFLNMTEKLFLVVGK